MSVIRVLVTTQVTLSRTFVVDEVPTDAAGDVTVTVKRLDGTTVDSATATHPGDPGLYRYVLPAQSTVDVLTVDWSGTVGGSAVTVRDVVEVVGGFLFGLSEARAEHASSLTPQRYSTATLAAKRIWVEQECERICGRAMVPRFARLALDGSGRDALVTPHLLLRTVRAVTVDGTAWTAGQLANVVPTDSGVIYLTSGTWPAGRRNIVVEVEHGEDVPPLEVAEAALTRFRSAVTAGKSNIPDRALSYTVMQGGVYRLATPAADRTGIPTVDAAYHGNRIDPGGFA